MDKTWLKNRYENQLRIHWFWLRDRDCYTTIDFLYAIAKNRDLISDDFKDNLTKEIVDNWLDVVFIENYKYIHEVVCDAVNKSL